MLSAVASVLTLGTVHSTVLTKYELPLAPGSAVCNDGTPYAYYLALGSSSGKWVFFQQGGSYCYSQETCDARASTDSTQMSSRGLSSSLSIASGIIADDPSENPYFATWNKVQLPYCTSDAFSGTVEQSAWKASLSFLGSRVIPAVIADLIANHSLVDASSTTVVYSGASAGGVGLWPNMDALSSKLLPSARVVAVVDSGWFLDSTPIAPVPCTDDPLYCSVKENLVNGVAAWSPALDAGCAVAKAPAETWQCLMGRYVEPYISTPLFVFQWQFDLAQLYHDGIYANPSAPAAVAAYAQGSRANLTASFGATAQPRHFFSPSCYQHVVLNNKHSGWMQVTAGSVTLPDALDAFVNGTSTPSTLLDACTTPDCNPTCPPPQNIG